MRRRIALPLYAMLVVTLLYATSYGQDAACTFSVSPATVHFFDIAGGAAEIQVKASGPRCTFNAKTDYPWITLSARQERGAGEVSVTVSGNEVPIYRIGSLLIDGEEVTVIQNGPRQSGGG